jgi:hypothetical protein
VKRVLVALSTLMLTTFGLGLADVQPVPAVGRQITLRDNAVAGFCFDSLESLKLSETYLNKWSGDKMDDFLGAHSMAFHGGEKAKVLAVYPTYTWTSAYGIDYVKPIQLLIESPYKDVLNGRNWQRHTCWWEFSQNSDMLLKFTWWK